MTGKGKTGIHRDLLPFLLAAFGGMAVLLPGLLRKKKPGSSGKTGK